MASSSANAAAAEVPKTRSRATSNASSGMDSDTGRLLNSLGSVGSGASLPDVSPALPDLPKAPEESPDENQFQVPASLPQHHQLKEDTSLHVSFTRLEENGSLTSSKGSRNLPEKRLPSKKRKMSYESYDSAMGDSYLGLASLDSGILPKPQTDLGSVNTKGSGGSGSAAQLPKISAIDHLDALGNEDHDDANLPPPAPVIVPTKKSPPPEGGGATEHGFKDPPPPPAATTADDNNSEATFTSSGHRLLMEAIMMTGGLEGGGGAGATGGARRNRLESWGGMSDLSVHMGPDQAAAVAASALHHTGIIEDVTAAANFGGGGSVASSVTDDQLLKPSSAGGEGKGRERTTSFSDSTFPVPSSLDGLEIPSDLQKFVAAAVASVGDQLAELAGNIESAAAAVDMDDKGVKDDDTRPGSEVSSIATPLVIGASVEDASRVTVSGQNSAQQGEGDAAGKDAATSAGAISVDYDAVAAAVDAANAAIGGLDLSDILGESVSIELPAMSTASSTSSGAGKSRRRRKLPTHKKPRASAVSHLDALGDIPKSSLSETEQQVIRERARKAAGYVPPSDSVVTTPCALPPKKRMKSMTPEPVGSKINSMATPRVSNTTKLPDKTPSAAATTKTKAGTKVKEKSTAKWDMMYDALLQYAEERKQEETAGQSEQEIAEWVWDGNVPTTYKTKDGKALGRWINNQRSAKSKGTLKEEREARLVAAGLKWSVLASNSWNEMLDELRFYIQEVTKDGKKWDGNVPTNYRIKAKPNGKKMSEEDKNLGRWVNRQRSLYQAGKLREDRQQALEKVGLKWSMLATTSWEAMYDTLVVYVQAKTKNGMKWDGNVPANYRTEDNPPRALGRWINRQRSAHVKKKLKQEYVDKLSKLGLKWSVHERKYYDDTQNTTPAKPVVVASGPAVAPQKAEIPSTIAVPAAKPSVRFDDSAQKPKPAPTVKPAPVPSAAVKPPAANAPATVAAAKPPPVRQPAPTQAPVAASTKTVPSPATAAKPTAQAHALVAASAKPAPAPVAASTKPLPSQSAAAKPTSARPAPPPVPAFCKPASATARVKPAPAVPGFCKPAPRTAASSASAKATTAATTTKSSPVEDSKAKATPTPIALGTTATATPANPAPAGAPGKSKAVPAPPTPATAKPTGAPASGKTTTAQTPEPAAVPQAANYGAATTAKPQTPLAGKTTTAPAKPATSPSAAPKAAVAPSLGKTATAAPIAKPSTPSAGGVQPKAAAVPSARKGATATAVQRAKAVAAAAAPPLLDSTAAAATTAKPKTPPAGKAPDSVTTPTSGNTLTKPALKSDITSSNGKTQEPIPCVDKGAGVGKKPAEKEQASETVVKASKPKTRADVAKSKTNLDADHTEVPLLTKEPKNV